MLFNSVNFICFLPIVLIVFYLTNQKWKWLVLLAASYIFYMAWNPAFIGLIILSTIVDYFCGIQIEQASTDVKKKLFLTFSIVLNLGLLFYFKYFEFFINSVISVANTLGLELVEPELGIILPVGISFYTFQTLSYSIDIYRGNLAASRHIGKFALFVSFFPQLVAGPIERATNLIPQLNSLAFIKRKHLDKAILYIVWGFFLKLVIADNVSIYVDATYANIDSLQGIKMLIPVALFSFQILADFGGYSFIAIGLAMLFGVKLMENFKSPYFAKSLSDFWTRWHISLSTWFKDYLYIPLGGNKKGSSRTLLNLAIVFIVSGIWHGSSWNFLIWGGVHAAAICLERVLVNKKRQGNSSWKRKMTGIGRTLLVFSIVTFNWVFFRSPDLSSSFLVFKQISTNFFGSVMDLGWIIKMSFLDDNYGLHSIARWIEKDFPVGTFVNIEFLFFTFYCTIPVLVVLDFYTRHSGIVKILQNETFLKRLFCSVLVVFIFLFGQFFTNDNFIYFQF